VGTKKHTRAPVKKSRSEIAEKNDTSHRKAIDKAQARNTLANEIKNHFLRILLEASLKITATGKVCRKNNPIFTNVSKTKFVSSHAKAMDGVIRSTTEINCLFITF
jgi:hypothetical protein